MLLEINDINKSFGGLLALQDISFSVEEGETLCIMGANGAGKTTLFSLIAGHAKPSRGKITLAGRQIDGMRPDQISALGIARTYQIVRPFRGLTVLENVAAGALYGSRQEKTMNSANDFAMEILSDVGLDDRANDLA